MSVFPALSMSKKQHESALMHFPEDRDWRPWLPLKVTYDFPDDLHAIAVSFFYVTTYLYTIGYVINPSLDNLGLYRDLCNKDISDSTRALIWKRLVMTDETHGKLFDIYVRNILKLGGDVADIRVPALFTLLDWCRANSAVPLNLLLFDAFADCRDASPHIDLNSVCLCIQSVDSNNWRDNARTLYNMFPYDCAASITLCLLCMQLYTKGLMLDVSGKLTDFIRVCRYGAKADTEFEVHKI